MSYTIDRSFPGAEMADVDAAPGQRWQQMALAS